MQCENKFLCGSDHLPFSFFCLSLDLINISQYRRRGRCALCYWRKDGQLISTADLFWNGIYPAEESVILVVNAGGEVEYVGFAPQAIVAEGQGPKPVNRYRVALLILELTEKGTTVKIKGIDAAVAKVANQ
jgi:hypothetical protein